MPVIPYPTDSKIQKQTSIGYERDLWIPGSDDYDVYGDSFDGDTLDVRYPADKTNGTSAAVTPRRSRSRSPKRKRYWRKTRRC